MDMDMWYVAWMYGYEYWMRLGMEGVDGNEGEDEDELKGKRWGGR